MKILVFILVLAVNILLILTLIKVNRKKGSETYEPKITMSLPKWRNFIASGQNTLLLSGGVIPSGTMGTYGGNSGAVYRGHVRQGYY